MTFLRRAPASVLFPLALLFGCGGGNENSSIDASVDAPVADAPAADATVPDASIGADASIDDASAPSDAALDAPGSADAAPQADGGGVIACGGRGRPRCPEGTYCDFPPESICGRADGPGVCEPMPGGCIPEGPGVCGCDGTTYSNACLAASAGVSVERDGACAAP